MDIPKLYEELWSIPLNDTLVRRDYEDRLEAKEARREAQTPEAAGLVVYPMWKTYEDRGEPLKPHCKRMSRYCPHKPACKW